MATMPMKAATLSPNDVLIFMQDMIRKEECARERFRRIQEGKERPAPKAEALKVINRVRRALEQEMNKHGGSIFSLVRWAFSKHDYKANGLLGEDALAAALRELKCPASREEVRHVLDHYRSGQEGMDYKLLVEDLVQGSRHFLQHPTARSNSELLSPASNPALYRPKPRTAIIDTFACKLKKVLLTKITRLGGTEAAELDTAFHRATNACKTKVADLSAFRTVMHALGLKMTAQEAKQVYKHFAEDYFQGIRYHYFIKEVLADISHWSKVPSEDPSSMLSLSPATHSLPSTDSYRSELYQFTSRPRRRPANRIVEKVKQRVKHTMDRDIADHGDSMRTVLLRAFVFWDDSTSEHCGQIGLRQLKGAFAKLHCSLNDDEALEILVHYDVHGRRLMAYREFIEDVCKLDRSWISHSDEFLVPITDFSARASVPPIVMKLRERLKAASDDWARRFHKIQGATGRDAFHGICLRFDRSCTGRVSVADFHKVLSELKLTFDEREARRILSWYQIGGDVAVDYGRILKDVFPESVLNGGSHDIGGVAMPELERRQAEVKAKKKGLQAQLRRCLSKEKVLCKQRST